MPSLPTCIGHEVGGEKAELFILRLRIGFSDRTHLATWYWYTRYQCTRLGTSTVVALPGTVSTYLPGTVLTGTIFSSKDKLCNEAPCVLQKAFQKKAKRFAHRLKTHLFDSDYRRALSVCILLQLQIEQPERLIFSVFQNHHQIIPSSNSK